MALSFLHGVAEYLTPVLTQSQFAEKGVLTPEEFVAAGDELTFKCPTWQWAAGDPSCTRPYLPVDKQMLVTRGVPCLRRVGDLDGSYSEGTEVKVDGGHGDEDWLAMAVPRRGDEDSDDDGDEMGTITASTEAVGSAPPAPDAGDSTIICGVAVTVGASHTADEATEVSRGSDSSVADAAAQGTTSTTAEAEAPVADKAAAVDAAAVPPIAAVAPEPPTLVEASDSDDEYADMATFEDDNLVVDEATAEGGKAEESLPYLRAEEPKDMVYHTRTYDLYITYDKYYQTPRVYLFGYDEHHRPLTEEQVFQDVMQDYANKTVTMEAHPQQPSAGLHAAIHPCRHAETMKRIIDVMVDAGHEPRPDQYLFVFLKFIQSVVPTINYDYTLAVHARGKE